MEHTIKELIEHCRGRHIYIQTHNFPDPDAIASGFGLQKLFSHFDIDSTVCYVGKIDRLNTKKMTELCGIEILSKEDVASDMKESDWIICVDSQKGAGNIEDLVGDEIACIDHHPFVDNGDMYYRDVTAVGSCATIITGYFRELGVEMDRTTATALLYGIKMDTLHFTRGVTAADIDAFAYLFPMANEEILQELEHNTMEFDDLRAYGEAIKNVTVYDRLGFARISFACPDALIAVVSDFVLSLVEVEVAVVYSERPDGWKFSVRSEVPEIDAGKLVAGALSGVGNGGGHAFMAGGMIRTEELHKLGDYPENYLQQRFFEEMKKQG
ncbi:MAG: DHH family phosphoesterase [Lachnospiraceae bacterium]|nr:DHH family phosphoesterase [Lachnospiraceae bacterium]